MSRIRASQRPHRETDSPGFAFRVLSGVLITGLHLVARLEVEGAEHLPATGPCILVPNHSTEMDPVVVGTAVFEEGRLPRFLAKEALFKAPVVGAVLRGTGQVPVSRRGGSAASGPPLKAAERIASEGHVVIVYPEGTLTRDPDLWPMRGKTGAARLALQHGIPVVPIGHWGDERIMPRYSRRLNLFPRRTIRARFAPEVDLDDLRGRPLDSATLREATNRIMAAITAVVSDLRGEPAPAERWDPAQHQQTEHGRYRDG